MLGIAKLDPPSHLVVVGVSLGDGVWANSVNFGRKKTVFSLKYRKFQEMSNIFTHVCRKFRQIGHNLES
jgi:hypothetical protein